MNAIKGCTGIDIHVHEIPSILRGVKEGEKSVTEIFAISVEFPVHQNFVPCFVS